MSRKTPEDEPPPPAKSAPGSRARQYLSRDQVKDLVKIAREAGKIRDLKDRWKRGDRFRELERKYKMRYETLLKWGRLYQAFGNELESLLDELGKTKVYILAYARDPAAALESGVPDRKHPGRIVDVRAGSAEELRRNIQAQQEDRHRRKRRWFRLDKKKPARSLKAALKRTKTWLVEDVARIVHRIQKGVTDGEQKLIRKFQGELSDLASSIEAALVKAKKRAKTDPKSRTRTALHCWPCAQDSARAAQSTREADAHGPPCVSAAMHQRAGTPQPIHA